jgi:hypothetical protein
MATISSGLWCLRAIPSPPTCRRTLSSGGRLLGGKANYYFKLYNLAGFLAWDRMNRLLPVPTNADRSDYLSTPTDNQRCTLIAGLIFKQLLQS